MLADAYSYMCLTHDSANTSCDSHLFNSHHSFHIARRVPYRNTCEAAIPVDHIVVHVASNKTKHVVE